MKTTTKTVTELIETKESPLPLEVIPNNMGINLCSVDALTWTQQEDGQLVSLTIHFVPAPNGQAHAEQNKRKNKMKKMMMGAAVLAACGMVAGCFTSATAYTETKHADGSVTVSRVNVIGTGDKASQVAAEGLFADGDVDDLGAGVKSASATQQSTGIKETLEGMGVLLTGIGSLVAKTQGIPVAATAPVSTDTAPAVSAETDYSTEGFGGSPGAGGDGVYGRPSCSRCQAYKAAHPDVQMIDIDIAANRAAMWAALRARGYTGRTAALPVAVTAEGYALGAK